MSPETLVSSVAATIGTLAFMPQAVKTIRLRQTRDISLLSYLALTTSANLWLIFGAMIGNWPLILGNGISLGLTLIIVVLKLRHG